MATKRDIVDYLLERLGREAHARPMFGEYGLYFRNVFIGLICDDRLFVKETESAARLVGPYERDSPYPGAKPAIIVAEDLWDTPVLLQLVAATAAELGPRNRAVNVAGARNRANTPKRRR